MWNLTNSGNLIDTINSKQSLIVQSANQPTNPNTGDYWYDTTNKLLKYYNWSSRDPVWANVRVLTQSAYDALTPAEKSNWTLYLITWDSEELTIKWANITDKPNFATVATSGSYNDLSNKPTIPSALWDLTGNSDNITEWTTNKFVTSAEKSKISTAVQPWDLAAVATSWSYNDLSDKPTIPSSLWDLSWTSDNITEWSTNKFVTTTEKSKISTAVQPWDLATVATSWDYNDLINLPSIPVDADDVNALPDTTKYWASLSMTMNTSTYVVTAQLKDQDGNNLWSAQTIDLPLESVVVSWSYDSATKKVILTLKDWSTVDFSVADLISWLQSEITSTNKLDADLVDDTNSAHKFVSATEKSTWNGKQAALTTAQLNAANSWITSAKVSTYDWYATTIAWKQAALNSDQLAAVNSWITATKVGTYDWYATSKQDKLTTQTAYTQKGSATKVPQITTNTLWQVTGIAEVDIDAGETYNAGEGIEIINWSDYSAMQWPCPEWYHVPVLAELQWVKTIMDWLSLTTWDSWRINLHIPFAGYRDATDGWDDFQDEFTGLWSSSTPNNGNAYSISLTPSKVTVGFGSRANAVSIRAFANGYIEPDSTWTVVQWTLWSAWIFWNQSEWLISITDWTTGYTMMDKNLWATTVYSNWDTLTTANCGNDYQWWNNYWFPYTGWDLTTSTTKVDASAYWPTNPYSSNTFILTDGSDWSSVRNDNLRWGVTWIIIHENVINNTGVLSVNWQTWNVTIQTGSEQNLFIITEGIVTVSTSEDMWVAPYSTSYKYTNIDINADAGIEWKEWAIYTFVVDTKMVVASAYRNVRVRIWDWAYIPVMATTAAASGSSYFAKTAIRQFQYTTKYESGWALHVFTDSNTTYKAMTEAQATAWTATTALTITPAVLKWAITTHAPVKSVNWATWAVTVQPTLVSGTNIKTVNNQSLLGSGNITTWDMKYADYNWSATTWATVTLSLNTEHTPSSNFTVNAPATIKDWQTYILRVANWATAYTMTLGTNITNPYSTSTTLTANWIDQFVFVAKWWSLELQPEIQWWGGSWGWTRWSITGTLSNQTDLNTALTAKADASSVLTKTNTTSYTPSANYHPATKKYVDDKVTVVSWNSWTTYTIKVSSSAPTSWTANNVITIVTN